MANFEFDFPQEMFTQLQRMEKNTDEIQSLMLEKSAPILQDEMKRTLLSIGASDTGQMIKSIKPRKPNMDKKGTWQVFVGPSGYDKTKTYKDKYGHTYKLSNVQKLIYYEFGTKNQPARPTLQRATNNAEKNVLNKMQEVFNMEVDK